MYSILNRTDTIIICLFLVIGMIAMVILGSWCNRKWREQDPEPKGGVNLLLGGLVALSGLTLAFTFGMSGNRLERVRIVVLEEANDIGTALLRSDLYSDSVRQEFRNDFKAYLEAVISFYDNTTNETLVYKAKDDAANAAKSLWARAAQQSKQPGMLIPSNQMVPALNSMFDIATEREVVLRSRVPDLILYMLFICVLGTCFIGGFTSSPLQLRSWVIIGGFAIITAMVVYTTIDLARPMRGTIKERAGRDAIVDLRKMF